MPRFFFHLHDEFDVPDDLGTDFPSLDTAVAYASRQIRYLAGHTVIETARIVLGHRIDIEDEHGAVLDSVLFRDVIDVVD